MDDDAYVVDELSFAAGLTKAGEWYWCLECTQWWRWETPYRLHRTVSAETHDIEIPATRLDCPICHLDKHPGDSSREEVIRGAEIP